MTRWRLPRDRSAHTAAPLLVRARDEPELFAEFYVAYYDQVLTFFARRVLDPETAFDLMAETFAAAFAGLPAFRGSSIGESQSWLWTIARNQLSRWIERGKVERRCMAELGIERVAMSAIEYERVEELAAIDRFSGEIHAALARLSVDHRNAIRLRVVDELTYEEIAVRLAVSQQVVRARVSRGLRELGRALSADTTDLQEALD